MVKNAIKVKRAEVRISQAALAEKMPDDVNKIVMNFIEAGRCLPTRRSLEAMCETFGCTPLDIYDAMELDLLSVGAEPEPNEEFKTHTCAADYGKKAAADSASRESLDTITTGHHKNMEQIRVWMPVVDKLALVKAIKGLGYQSTAEWMREMQRDTIQRYIALRIEGNISTDTLKHPLKQNPE